MSVIGHTGLRHLEVVGYGSMEGVEPGLVGRVVTSVETVNANDIGLTNKQLTAIMSEICDRDTLTLKVLILAWNSSVNRVEPGLLARAVMRLREVNVSGTFLTEEQVTAIREAAARSSCRVIYNIRNPYWM